MNLNYTGTTTVLTDLSVTYFYINNGKIIFSSENQIFNNSELYITGGEFILNPGNGTEFSSSIVNMSGGTINMYKTSIVSIDTFNISSGILSGTTLAIGDTNYSGGIISSDNFSPFNLSILGGSFISPNILSVRKNLILSGGTFTSTSGNLTVYGDFLLYGGTFDHNSGTTLIRSNLITDQTHIISGEPSFYNLGLRANNSGNGKHTFNIATSITVKNKLTIHVGTANSLLRHIMIDNGLINCEGDVSYQGSQNKSGSTLFDGTATIELNGTIDQYVTGSTTPGYLKFPNMRVNKPSGTLYFTSDLSIAKDFTYIKGNVNVDSNTFYLYGSTLDAQGTGSTMSFNNVKIMSGTTLTGNIDINGVLTINNTGSTLNCSGSTINLSNNLVNNGTINSDTSTFIFDGTTVVSGSNNPRFYNVTINSGATLNLPNCIDYTKTLIDNGTLLNVCIAHWNGSADDNYWNTSTNWSTGLIPIRYTDVVFDDAFLIGDGITNPDCYIDMSNSCNNFTINSGFTHVFYQESSFDIYNDFTMNGGDFIGTGGWNPYMKVYGNFTINNADFIPSAGELSLYKNFTFTSGTFDVSNRGTIIFVGDTTLVGSPVFNNVTINNGATLRIPTCEFTNPEYYIGIFTNNGTLIGVCAGPLTEVSLGEFLSYIKPKNTTDGIYIYKIGEKYDIKDWWWIV